MLLYRHGMFLSREIEVSFNLLNISLKTNTGFNGLFDMFLERFFFWQDLTNLIKD